MGEGAPTVSPIQLFVSFTEEETVAIVSRKRLVATGVLVVRGDCNIK